MVKPHLAPDADNPSNKAILAALLALKPRETVVYYSGTYLPADVIAFGPLVKPQTLGMMLKQLYEARKIAFAQRRSKPPTLHDGTVDWVSGIGEFEYLAVGAK